MQQSLQKYLKYFYKKFLCLPTFFPKIIYNIARFTFIDYASLTCQISYCLSEQYLILLRVFYSNWCCHFRIHFTILLLLSYPRISKNYNELTALLSPLSSLRRFFVIIPNLKKLLVNALYSHILLYFYPNSNCSLNLII